MKEAQMIYGYVDKEVKDRFSSRYLFLSPRWSGIKTTSQGPTHSSMYVPIGFNDSTGNYLHILIMKDEGRLRSMLIEIQPEKDWWKSHRNVEEYQSLTGKLIFYSINGLFHQGYSMKDGEATAEYIPEQELRNPATLLRLNQISSSGTGVTIDGQPCTWGTFGCQELSEVKIVIGKKSTQTNYVYIYIPTTIYSSSPNGGNYSSYTWYPSGGTVTSSPKRYLPYGIISNELSNPCLNNTYNALTTNFGAITDIGWILQSIFGVGDAFDVRITQTTSLASDVDGETIVGSSGDYYNAVIRLNENTLPGASREYVAATIYHEIIHAALQIDGQLSELDSHEKMVGYIGKMTATLRALYPHLSQDEAKALSWGGLHTTQAWAQEVQNNPSYVTYVNSINGMHKIRANGAGMPCL